MVDRILGVDPGASHVGVSEWVGAECKISYELEPLDFVDLVFPMPFLRRFTIFCAEDYVSEGGFGSAKTGADTTKLLGWFEHHVRMVRGVDVRLTTRLDRSGALKRLKAVGYPFHDLPHASNHARDAEAVVVAAMRWGAKDVLESNPPRPGVH